MLTEFQLTNFKAFAGPETIPIRPITLIFGPNSSGKSSIFQSLLMLKQTLEEAAGSGTTLLYKGNLVDLGSYREFIHRHDVERSFSFKITMPLPKDFEDLWQMPVNLSDNLRKEFIELKEIIAEFKSLGGMRISFSYEKESLDTFVSNLDLFLGDVITPIVTYKNSPESKSYLIMKLILSNFIGFIDKYYPELKIDKNADYSDIMSPFLKEMAVRMLEEGKMEKDDQKDNIMALLFKISHEGTSLPLFNYLPVGIGHLPPEEIISKLSGYDSPEAGNISILTLVIAKLFQEFLKNLLYIGPLRESPTREFTFSGTRTQYVGKSGKFVPDLLISDKELKEKVNGYFNRLDIGYELEVPRLSDPDYDIHDVFSLRLFDKSTGVYVGITDVGFGISQVLPVIIQSLISNAKTILIEQPEYHLHPRLQAELGDMFIESALGGRRNTFLIETHSEHLILRIMRRMRDTFNGTLPEGLPPIRPQDVAVLYVEKDGTQSIVREMPLNERGELLKAWPGGFFEEALEEVFA